MDGRQADGKFGALALAGAQRGNLTVMEKKAVNRPVADLSRTGDKDLIDVITNHAPNEGSPSGLTSGRTHAERVMEALGNMFMDITCSHCGSNKVIRAGACGVCTECGTSQGCS